MYKHERKLMITREEQQQKRRLAYTLTGERFTHIQKIKKEKHTGKIEEPRKNIHTKSIPAHPQSYDI